MPIEVSLRPVIEEDVAEFWGHHVTHYTGPTDRLAFTARWRGILANANAPIRTIVADGNVVGYVARFRRNGLPEVSYELGRPYWGKGLATAALSQFLHEVTIRPIYARAAKDNPASIRVLEKCGFVVAGEDRFTDTTGQERDELIFALREPGPTRA